MNNNNNNINNNNNNIFLELIPHKIFSFCEIIEYFILLKHQKMKNIFLLVAKEKIFICDENLKILFKKEFLFDIDYLIELSNSLILFSEKTFFYLTKIKYKKKTFEIKKIFYSFHKETITKIIELQNKKIISCSKDHSIKIFNFHSKNLKIETNIFYFFGRISSLLEIKNSNEIVASSFTEKTLKFFDSNSYEIKSILNDIKINDYSNTICLYENFLLIGIFYEIILID